MRLRTLCLLAVLAILRGTSPALAAVYTAVPGTLGLIPDGGPFCPSTGPARDVRFIAPVLIGTVDAVTVTLLLAHPFVGELRATLIAPDGTSHVLFARTGALVPGGTGDASPLSGAYTFSDGAAGNFWSAAAATSGAVPPGAYRTSAAGGNLGGGITTTLAATFDDVAPSGTWIVRLEDGCQGNIGQVIGASLSVAEQTQVSVNGLGSGPIPDAAACGVPGAPRDITFDYSRVLGAIHGFEVGLGLTHTSLGDLRIELVAPDGRSHLLAARTGATAVTDRGDDTNLNGIYVFRDAGADWWQQAATLTSSQTLPPSAYRSSRSGGPGSSGDPTPFEAPFAGAPVTGIWTVRITDLCPGDTGSVTPSYMFVALQPMALPTTLPQPASLRVERVRGDQVTLRWRRSSVSPPPTSYLLEGGVTPGQPIATLPTGGTTPTFTFTAPPGSFQVRLRAVKDAQTSLPSIEIPLHVSVPLAPSPPAPLLGTAEGAGLTLAWQPTFAGGEATAFELDVTGTATATLPLGALEQFRVANVPPGTYTFRVRGVNGAGSSAPSAPVTLTLPAACAAPPLAPPGLVVAGSGRTLQVAWDLPEAGSAPTSYVLDVSSPIFTGILPVTERSLTAPVPPGTYTFRVAAQNACGPGAFSGLQSVIIP